MTNPSTSTRRLRGCPTVLFNPTYALAFQDNTLSVIEHLPGVDEEMCVRASIHIRWAKYLQSHICSIMAQDAGRWNVDLSSELSALFSASPQNTERRIPSVKTPPHDSPFYFVLWMGLTMTETLFRWARKKSLQCPTKKFLIGAE
jgi:hypothetical protein